MKENLLTFEDFETGIQKVTFSISSLYSGEKPRGQFEKRFCEFLKSHPAHSEIFERTGDKITYRTESIIPTKDSPRHPLLLVFGNPASQSVESKMFFSFEGKRREHRFWKILREAEIVCFSPITKSDSICKVNQLRKEALYELSYCSPFRIGLAVYYSMPSPASNAPWAGVAGLHRLFGKEALGKIGKYEKRRIARIIKEFVSPSGTVIAFQKDAYLAIKSSASPDYKLEEAKAGHLVGTCHCDTGIKLFCLPPTRRVQGTAGLLRDALFGVQKWGGVRYLQGKYRNP